MLRYETGYPDWDPFSEMRQLQAEMNRAFGSHGRQQQVSSFPPVNLWIGDSSIAITAEVPGFSQDDIDLQVQENSVTIEGERKPVEGVDGLAWHLRERGYGHFARTIELPFRVDPDHVVARLANGILEIELQRPQADLPQKIKIKAK